jgi:hypothetical protein
VTITGTGFGKAGVVKFGSVVAKVSSYSATKIVVTVPKGGRSDEVKVTVTPVGGKVSKGVEFEYENNHRESRQGSRD